MEEDDCQADQELLELIQEFREDAQQGAAESWVAAEKYCHRVLRHDLRHVKLRGAAPEPADVLVLLCGLSQAPLLLATAWLRPARVILVGSDTDPGPAEVDEMQRNLQVGAFPEETGLWELPVTLGPAIASAEPAAAYRELVALLKDLRRQHEADRIVVDVTGGKKTMVAGAFVAASEAGVRTQYVDFDAWEPSARMPEPGSSFVRELRDPATVFRVRELAAVQQAFDAERFGEAVRRLEDVLPDLEKAGVVGYIEPAEVARYRRRLAYAKACQRWAETKYDKALEVFEQPVLAGVEVPRAVQEIGSALRSSGGRDAQEVVLSDARLAALYVGDELWRHRRALLERAEEPKGPYLRLYGLVETLLTVALYPLRDKIFEIKRDGTELPRFPRAQISVRKFAKSLMQHKLATLGCRVGEEEMRLKLDVTPAPLPVAEELVREPRRWAEIRNTCTHTIGVVDPADAGEFVTRFVPELGRQAFTALGLKALIPDLLEGNGDGHRPRRWKEVS